MFFTKYLMLSNLRVSIHTNALVLIIGVMLSHPTHLVMARAVDKKPFFAKVEQVVDGDTIVVDRGSYFEKIRLWGIDSPEWDQPYSHLSKQFLKKKILNKNVRLEPYYLDAYDRTIAQVFYDGININQLLIEQGYAWVHVYYCRKKVCAHWKKLEGVAKEKKIGIWKGNNPIPPWKWKRMKRGKNHNGVSDQLWSSAK